jgi:hypothetical protein
MAPARSVFPRLFVGLTLVLMISVFGSCSNDKKAEGEKKAETGKKAEIAQKSEGETGEPEPILSSTYNNLLYFQSTDSVVAKVPYAYTSGNPTSTGDQLAWVLIPPAANPTITIASITMPAVGCGNSTVPIGWTPYPRPVFCGQLAGSGPLSPPTAGTNSGSYDLYYKIMLSTGSGPCGHIVIVKP